MKNQLSKLLILAPALVLATGVAGIAAMPAAAYSAATPPDGLSITITDNVDELADGSTASYEAELTNAGSKSVTVTLIVTVPEFASIENAKGGNIDGSAASWKLKVAAGKSKSVVVDAVIGDIPAATYRITTLTSVYLGTDTDAAPIIASADADTIPGVDDPVAPSDATATVVDEEAGFVVPTTLLWVLVGVLAIVVGAVVVLVVRRRGESGTDAPTAPRRRSGGPAVGRRRGAEEPAAPRRSSHIEAPAAVHTDERRR